MNYYFCTLFNKNYFYKGLAMYFSLRNNLENFTLWILCMDEDTYNLLNQMQLPNIKLIALKDFETDDLKKVKKERTIAEY
ncbi:glycosyl transferase, partial [Candidatus Wolfebacteria bacterium CG10_big_fil_rev_8_21_14_0_10_31_9]